MTKSKLSLNVQHSYITLRTPNGNFTKSYSGWKASGKLATDNKAVNAIVDFVKKETTNSTVGKAMEKLCNEKTLSKLWPNWNEEAKPAPKVSQKVDAGKYGKGEVKKVTAKNAQVLFEVGPYKGRTIAMPFDMLEY